MSEHKKWFVIVNPVSGFGKAHENWRYISHELTRQQVPFEYEYTMPDSRGDKMVQLAIRKGYHKFICVGGDGHLHDIVNGIMTQAYAPTTEITVAMISQGTGNDWIRTNGVPKNYKKAISAIKACKTYIQNVGLAKAFRDGQPVQRYFHNFAGVGFDAAVVQHTMHSKGYGQLSYLIGMLKCLLAYHKPILRITLDDRVIETVTYLTLSGIGQYGGGGMKLTPGAKPDGDSLFVSVAKDFSKWDVLRYTGKLYDGSFLELNKAEGHPSKNVKIEVVSSQDEVYMEADGDMVGTGPWEISFIPKALKVVIP
jgi:diacylglycerol kinase family enzyme